MKSQDSFICAYISSELKWQEAIRNDVQNFEKLVTRFTLIADKIEQKLRERIEPPKTKEQ